MIFNQAEKVDIGNIGNKDVGGEGGVAAASLHGHRLRLQQQPARAESDRQQQQSSGSGEFQPCRLLQPGQLGASAGPSSRQQ